MSTCRFCEERYINCRRGRNGPLCYRLLPTEPLNEQAIKILSEMSVRVTKLARKIGSMASLCFRSGIVTLSINIDALDADEFAAADVWSNTMARAIHTGNENEVSVGRRGRTRTCDLQLRRLGERRERGCYWLLTTAIPRSKSRTYGLSHNHPFIRSETGFYRLSPQNPPQRVPENDDGGAQLENARQCRVLISFFTCKSLSAYCSLRK